MVEGDEFISTSAFISNTEHQCFSGQRGLLGGAEFSWLLDCGEDHAEVWFLNRGIHLPLNYLTAEEDIPGTGIPRQVVILVKHDNCALHGIIAKRLEGEEASWRFNVCN